MQIGDHKLDLDDAFRILQEYAVIFMPGPCALYDLAGDPGGHPGPGNDPGLADTVTLGDIGRLVAINAALERGRRRDAHG